MKQIN